MQTTVSVPRSPRKSSGRSPGKPQEPVLRGNSLKLVFTEIRELIVRGKLSPGTWIIEADLADRLGYSRTPVRGALHWLQREGYVVASGNTSKSRMIVAPLTKEDARELYSIIGHIEGLGARLTAQLSPAVRAKLIRKLKELNDGLQELAQAKRREPNRIFDLDMNFHRTIVEASAGPRLLELHRSTSPKLNVTGVSTPAPSSMNSEPPSMSTRKSSAPSLPETRTQPSAVSN